MFFLCQGGEVVQLGDFNKSLMFFSFKIYQGGELSEGL